jgi:hypothetical protein
MIKTFKKDVFTLVLTNFRSPPQDTEHTFPKISQKFWEHLVSHLLQTRKIFPIIQGTDFLSSSL